MMMDKLTPRAAAAREAALERNRQRAVSLGMHVLSGPSAAQRAFAGAVGPMQRTPFTDRAQAYAIFGDRDRPDERPDLKAFVASHEALKKAEREAFAAVKNAERPVASRSPARNEQRRPTAASAKQPAGRRIKIGNSYYVECAGPSPRDEAAYALLGTNHSRSHQW